MIIGKQKILFCVSILLFVLYLSAPYLDKCVKSVIQREADFYCMDVPVVSQEYVEALIQDKELSQIEEGICFNYAEAPFDVVNQTAYIYQNTKTSEWEGLFSLNMDLRSAGYSLYFLEDELFREKEQAIKNGHEFVMYAVGDTYAEIKVVFSGLGVMSISQKTALPQEVVDPDVDPDTYYLENQPEYIGETTVLCMDEGEQYQTVQGYVKYHLKGATSVGYPKKSYAITFVDEGGKDVSLSVFGMESYSKWKLNSLYTDNTLVREKSAIDIWRTMDQHNTAVDNGGFQSRYVELVVDGVYVGVYLLVEAVDGEKLDLDNDDFLYKCINWKITDQSSIDEAITRKWKVVFPFRIKYPNEIVDYVKAWGPIKDFNNAFFNNESVVDKSLQESVNVENVIDVSIFLQVCALSDNHYKNLYYAAHVNPDGTYKMTLHPWDFDLSFGHIYQSGAEGSYCYEEAVQINYDLRVLDGLIAENAEIGTYVYDTYIEYREDILSDERITEIINNNWVSLQESGAYTRNLDLWMLEYGDSDVDTVLQYTMNRLEYLDVLYQRRYKENSQN